MYDAGTRCRVRYNWIKGSLEGGVMNRIEKKETAPRAAKLFEEEVREINSDTPREVICDMVDNYLYYQQDDLTKDEAHLIVEETCIKK